MSIKRSFVTSRFHERGEVVHGWDHHNKFCGCCFFCKNNDYVEGVPALAMIGIMVRSHASSVEWERINNRAIEKPSIEQYLAFT
jgi:hypothetical protein